MGGGADLTPISWLEWRLSLGTALIDALKEPMSGFVREGRVRICLLVNGAGQVLSQHGFTRSYEVMNVASLAAAIHAAWSSSLM